MADQDYLSGEQKEELRQQLDMETRRNPFTYEPNFNWWEKTKMFFGIVVIPVRLFFATFFLFMIWALAKIAILGHDINKPMSCWRRTIFAPSTLFCRLLLFSCGIVWISTKGKRAKRKDAPIIVCAPHSTVLDVFLSFYAVGRYSGFGKKEVTKTPFFGTFALVAQTILVDRQNKQAKQDSLDELVRRADAENEYWPYFLVFPEGTCTNRTSLIRYQRGAFVPGKPVQQILFTFPYRNFDPTWTSSTNRKWQILRLLSQVYTPVQMEYCDVYVPNEDEKEDPFLFATNMRAVAAEKLGIPTTDHSYEDTFLSQAARKANFNPNDIVDFEFKHMKSLLEIDLKEAKRLLKRFGADPTVKKTGHMNVDEFAKALHIPLTEPVEEMFNLLDKDGVGFINFRSFLIGLTFISKNASMDDGIDVLFEALDPEGTGKISSKSLYEVFSSVFKKVNKKSVKALFKAADPEKTGFVDRDMFAEYIKSNPELLVAGLQIKSEYDRKGRPLSVKKKSSLNIPMNEKAEIGAPNPICDAV